MKSIRVWYDCNLVTRRIVQDNIKKMIKIRVLNSFGSECDLVANSCENVDKSSSCLRAELFLEKLSDCKLLRTSLLLIWSEPV
jgi:hypothetical protein